MTTPKRRRLRQGWRLELADRLHAARLLARLTQEQLGKAIGIVQAAVSHMEAGDNLPSLATAMLWCAACGVKPNVALDGLTQ